MKLLKLGLLAVVLLAGCKQNPFEGGRGRVVQIEPPKAEPVMPPLTMDLPQSVDLMEGATLELPLKPSVPAPGRPVVTHKGLPDGAIFEPETMTVHWVADFEAANDPRNLETTIRTYPLEFVLASSENPTTVEYHHTLLVVHDVPRTTAINLPKDPLTLTEGKPFEQTIEVESEDFPNGPFELQVQNLPVGAEIHHDLTQQGKFTIKYTPPYQAVDVFNSFSTYRVYKDTKIKVQVFAPRGTAVGGPVTWRVEDVREKAKILAPKQITQGTSVTFTVSAEDPNGEGVPTLSIVNKPDFGVMELTTESEDDGDTSRGINPSIVSSVRWVQIPPEKIGTSHDLSIRACVYANRYYKTNCDTRTVTVKFEQETHAPPTIDRSALVLGEVRYIKERETLQVPLRVRDGEFLNSTPSVKISPDAASDEVTWENGMLTIEGKKPGLKQFSVTATSVYGAQQTESFLYEVLPGTWASVVLFGESPNDAEVKATMDFFDSVQPANPVLQLNDPRVLVLRKTAYVGTTALNEPSVVKQLEKLVVQVKDIIVATPLLDSLQGALKDELTALGIKAGPKVANLAGYDFAKHTQSTLLSPSSPLTLLGKRTAASAQPVAVEFTGSDCDPLWVLQKTGETDIPVGWECKRSNGGKIIVAGFEFSDLQNVPADRGIVKKWLTELVEQ
ncbi:hypothetical protein K2X33_08615 [bacterium]|nr:hypothetical protein [bacterium]